MPDRLIECVANFSEGRRVFVVDAIVEAIASELGAVVLHRTSDADHNRSVVTFAGSPESVIAAAVKGVGKAVDLIDLNHHQGVHPRIGAADVIPFVPIKGVSLDDCNGFAIAAAAEIWERFRVPAYLYEASARTPDRKRLENVRRGQFEKLRAEAVSDPSRAPDIGGPALHPTAGAVAIGARKILIAFNVNLVAPDVESAKIIASRIRASSGGLPHVKALGLALPSRNQAQVSINLTDIEVTPLHVVFDAVVSEARSLGIGIASSELIGLMPRTALEAAAVHYLRIENFRPHSVLETRLEEASR